VLHWTAGAKYVAPPDPRGLGYHLEIDENGTIYQTGDFSQKLSHAGCYKKTVACAEMNGKAIGISYVGGTEKDATKGYVRTWADWQNTNLSLGNGTYNAKAQWEGIINSIILAKEKHPTINAITSHHLTAADKIDIGDDFPWERLLDEIEARTTEAGTKWRPLLATKWYDNSNTNQGALVHEFRGSVKKEDILSNLTPLELERNQPANVVVPDTGLKLAEVYDYLHSAGLSKNLTIGIMANMYRESQFVPTVFGDKRSTSVVNVNNSNYSTLRSKNGNYYCSWGLTGINVCGGAGVEFLQRNNLTNGTNEQKISALTNPSLHMDYVIYATKKLYPNTYMTERTPEEWAIDFAMDYENCGDCGSPAATEVKRRAAAARTLATQNFYG
jgi:N-acetyl-anhydromuramyl-L-alanine amidase AmpD